MADTHYPLLVFPDPVPADRAKRTSGGGRLRGPDAAVQAHRLVPQFRRLQEAMEKRHIALQDNPLGLLPEQALVLETIGSIENFIRAVEKISGLEWLAEYELEDIAPQYGFEDEESPDKQLKGRLFLVMTEQQALSQLQSLFERWRRDRDVAFPSGLAPLRHAFLYLRTIRPWDVEDRIRETGILEDWQDRLEHDESDVPFEAEFWFRRNAARRDQVESQMRDIIAAMEGELVESCVIPDIAYHAVLGRLPRSQVQAIIGAPEAFRDILLLQCEDIMHVRPVGQCAVRLPDEGQTEPLSDEELARLVPERELADGAPVVALFDGMPLTGHRLLDNRVIVDDPDGYEAAYQAHERMHGTGMASLICHGDLDQGSDAAEKPLYARPILQPRRGYGGHFMETIPPDVLPVDLIHRAVRRLFEPEGDEPPAAPTVRFVSLSICDPMRPLLRQMSSWARLLDWLAWKYRILFIVSAGNHRHDIELEIPPSSLGSLVPDQRERAIIRAVASDTRNRRLLSPAETLNGLTVGALHQDASRSAGANLIDPFVQMGGPNVVSAHGPGYRRAIKPDVFLPGGRQLLTEKLGTDHSNATLRIANRVSPPGQRVAAPGDPGQLDRTWYTRGTSNATAIASRGAGILYRLIDQLRLQPGVHVPREYDVVLTKALLAHGAGWESALSSYEAALKNRENSREFKEYVGRFLGYGSASLARVVSGTEERITVLGFGELEDGEGAVFSLPLPPCLSSVNERRRLTITLAWLSPVNSFRQAYRVAHLWFDPKNTISPTRLFADHDAVQRGALQHEVLEGDKATVFQDGDAITIKVNCRADAGDIPAPVRYGLAITLEAVEGAQQRLFPLPIYEEVRDRLAIRIPVQDASSE